MPRLRDLPTSRIRQALLLMPLLAVSWFAMQMVHEAGHALAAALTGGRVQRVVIHPLQISRTDVHPNPRPLIVAWGGPIVGCLAPWLVSAAGRRGGRYKRYSAFFAGFCLVANGAYIGLGSFEAVGDAGDLLRGGSSILWLWAFGLIAVALGVWKWHRISAEFGFGPKPERILAAEIAVAWATCAVAAVIAIWWA